MPVYKDTHCNRLAGRVGKSYGAKKKDKLHKAADKRGPAPARPRHTKGAPPPPPGKPPSKKRGPPPPPPGRPPSKTHSAKHLKKIRKGATYDKDHQKRLDSLGKKGGRNPIPPPPPKGKPPSKKRGPPPPPPGKPPKKKLPTRKVTYAELSAGMGKDKLHSAADKRGKAPAPPKKAQGPAPHSKPRGKKAKSVAGTGKRTAMMPKRSVVPAPPAKPKAKAKAKGKGRTAFTHGAHHEDQYHNKRLGFKNSGDDTYYHDHKTGKFYEAASGGRATGKANKDGTYTFGGRGGATLQKHSSGVFFNRDTYRHDWWKTARKEQAGWGPGKTKNEEQMGYGGYQVNRFS